MAVTTGGDEAGVCLAEGDIVHSQALTLTGAEEAPLPPVPDRDTAVRLGSLQAQELTSGVEAYGCKCKCCSFPKR